MKTICVESLPSVSHLNTPVITTKLLSRLYGTTAHSITKNHRSNTDRFVVEKHYFKVAGEELETLRITFGDLQISPKTRSLILWTERGAARHAKMLETEQAWEVFERLEDCYFNRQSEEGVSPRPLLTEKKVLNPAELDFYIPPVAITFERNAVTQLNALFGTADFLNQDFWPKISALFPQLGKEYRSAFDTLNLLLRLLKNQRHECEALTRYCP